jgi:hypothetical protein
MAEDDEVEEAIRAFEREWFEQLAAIADQLEAKALIWTTPPGVIPKEVRDHLSAFGQPAADAVMEVSRRLRTIVATYGRD